MTLKEQVEKVENYLSHELHPENSEPDSLEAYEAKRRKQIIAELKQKLKHEEDLHKLRKTHAWCLFGLIVFWIFMLWLMLGFVGYKKIELHDSVIIAAITSTTASVLGLYGIAAYWMFGKKAITSDDTQEI